MMARVWRSRHFVFFIGVNFSWQCILGLLNSENQRPTKNIGRALFKLQTENIIHDIYYRHNRI